MVKLALERRRTPRKIVIVSDTVYPWFKGGKEVRIHEITKRMARMGYDVHIYTMKWWQGPNDITKDGVRLHSISKHVEVYKETGRRSMLASLFFALSCLRLMTVSFDVIDVDHMPYMHLFTVWLVCLIRRKHMVATWHEVWPKKYWDEYVGRMGLLAYIVEYLAVYLPRTIIAASSHTKERLSQRHPSKQDRFMATCCGVDLAEIASIQPSPRRYDCMYAGRLIRHKNIDLLIKAVRQLKVTTHPDIRCIIVGGGPDEARLQSYVRHHGLEDAITFTGFLADRKEVYALMKSAKSFVLPSGREGFGMVVVEANACGTPVLTYNVPDNGACRLIQEGVNGYLFKTPQELAYKLEICLGHEPENAPQQYTQAAQPYDWNQIVDSVLDAYAI